MMVKTQRRDKQRDERLRGFCRNSTKKRPNPSKIRKLMLLFWRGNRYEWFVIDNNLFIGILNFFYFFFKMKRYFPPSLVGGLKQQCWVLRRCVVSFFFLCFFFLLWKRVFFFVNYYGKNEHFVLLWAPPMRKPIATKSQFHVGPTKRTSFEYSNKRKSIKSF